MDQPALSHRLYIFDLDGTLYRGEEAIPGAVEAVSRLRARGGLVRFLTNNSSQTRETFASKLSRMGFEATPDEVESSATGTTAFLVNKGTRSVGVIGEPGLVATFREAGLTAFAPDEEWPVQLDAVVSGIFRQLRYDHLAKAMEAIRAGAEFVATNADPTYPVESGRVIPGAGTIVAALRTCSEVQPFVVGKPNPFLTQLVMEKAGCLPSETLVIGDRMDTDIESGQAAGCDTLLVLTGVTHVAPEGQAWAPDLTELF